MNILSVNILSSYFEGGLAYVRLIISLIFSSNDDEVALTLSWRGYSDGGAGSLVLTAFRHSSCLTAS